MNKFEKLWHKMYGALIGFDTDRNLALIRLTFDKDDLVNISKALEKQIPYKPTDIGRAYTGERMGTCKCGNDEVFEHEKHCSNCGREMDWENVA